MTRLEEIAAKARAGEELTEDDLEYVVKVLENFIPILEQTWEWVRGTVAQVVAIWLDALKKLEEEQLCKESSTPAADSGTRRRRPTARDRKASV